jgi:hypothetical protein
MRPTLFLNLDGVVHPQSTQYVVGGDGDGRPRPFAWVDRLEPLAESWDLDIVFRSSATMVLGYERVKSMAPPWLQARISGATDEVVRWLTLYEARKVNTNFGVVRRYVEKHDLRHWVTLDDSDDGWPDAPELRKHLVQVDGSTGLSDPIVCKRLNLAFADCKP